MTRDEIAAHVSYNIKSLDTILFRLRKRGLLSHEDTAHLRQRGHAMPQLAAAIKKKMPLKEILSTFKLKNKTKLNGNINICYEQGLLKAEDVQYLKDNKSVLGRKGETKAKILSFLEEIHTSPATETLIELVQKFNNSRHQTRRLIKVSTFMQHVRELNLPPEYENFIDECRERPRGREVKTIRRALGTSQQVFNK